MTKLKLIIALIISVILEIFILCLSVAISTLEHYKLRNMTSEIMNESYSNLLFDPISTISGMISKRDPVLIIGTMILVGYMTYEVYKLSNEDTYKIESKYTVHGSSRFANYHEILVQDEMIGIPVEQLFKDFERSMEVGCEKNEISERKKES